MECAKAEWNARIKIFSNNSRLHMSVECRFGMLRPLVYDYGIAWHIDCIAISKSHYPKSNDPTAETSRSAQLVTSKQDDGFPLG